jgi:holo-[acyl-carrier protein] synthase
MTPFGVYTSNSGLAYYVKLNSDRLMQILGIGTDIIEIERIAKVVQENPRFTSRVFTESELNYCADKKSCYSHLAGRFAAKEAVGKAIGCPLSWQDVEIVNGTHGKPVVRLSGEAKELTQGCEIMVTISHSQNYATATAIMFKNNG